MNELSKLEEVKKILPDNYAIVDKAQLDKILHERRVFISSLNKALPILSLFTPNELEGGGDLNMMEVFMRVGPELSKLKDDPEIKNVIASLKKIMEEYKPQANEESTL